MLKELRVKAGLTQAELAKALGYPHATSISNIETGLTRLSPRKFRAAAEALHVPLEALIEEDLRARREHLSKLLGLNGLTDKKF